MKKKILAVFISGLWISFSEFFRNEILFKNYWLDKYASLGMEFPSEIINNFMWGIWSFLFAGCIIFLLRKLKCYEVFMISWIMVFVLMWITIGNLNVLPYKLLFFAIPLSIIETGGAVFIGKIILKKESE